MPSMYGTIRYDTIPYTSIIPEQIVIALRLRLLLSLSRVPNFRITGRTVPLRFLLKDAQALIAHKGNVH